MTLAKSVLGSVLGKAFDNVRWILDDVDEEDCFWEPADRCWSVRRREKADVGWGTGDWVCEDSWPPPNPLPVTTIAWRMAHLAAWTEIGLLRDLRRGHARVQPPAIREEPT